MKVITSGGPEYIKVIEGSRFYSNKEKQVVIF